MATKNIALNVLANVQKYQKKMSELPGITEREAARAAVALEKRLSKAQFQAAEDARKAAQKGAASWKDAFKGVTLAITPGDIRQAVSELADLTKQAIDLRNSLADASVRTGLAVDTLQALRFAAKGSGQEFSALESSLNQFPKRMADVARGTGEAKAGMDALGLSADFVSNGKGGLRDMDEIFNDLLVRLGDIEDDGERAAIATQLLGESGGKIVQAFGGATGTMDAYKQQLAIIGDRTSNAAEGSAKWQRQMAQLEAIWEAFTGQLADGATNTGLLDFAIESLVAQMVVWPAVIQKATDEIVRMGSATAAFVTGDWDGLRAALDMQVMSWDDVRRTIVEAREAYRQSAATIDGNTGSTTDNTGETDDNTRARFNNAEAARAQAEALKEQEEAQRRALDAFLAADDLLRESQERSKPEERWLKEQAAINEVIAGLQAYGDDQQLVDAKVGELQALRDQRYREYQDAEKELARESALAWVEAEAEKNKKISEERDRELDKEKERREQLRDITLGAATDALNGVVALNAALTREDEAAAARQLQLDAEVEAAEAALSRAKTKAEMERAGERYRNAVAAAEAQADAVTETGRRQARRAAILEKTAAIFSIGVNTAQAIMKGFAIFGPPPSPAGIAAAAAAGIAGGIQAAAVAAQPVQFHTGTSEVPALLTPREAVLTPRAADTLGRGTIDALNRGTGMHQGPAVAVVSLDGRALDRVVHLALRSDGRAGRLMREGGIMLRNPYR